MIPAHPERIEMSAKNIDDIPDPRRRTSAFGLTPLEDQQLGGLIMWVPAGVVYVVVGLAFFAAWLGALGGGRVAARAAE